MNCLDCRAPFSVSKTNKQTNKQEIFTEASASISPLLPAEIYILNITLIQKGTFAALRERWDAIFGLPL